MEQVRIRLDNISKSYYSETTVTQALRKINLTFAMGEFVAITGESGSGKSTLLSVIGGTESFDDGEMYVDGQPTFQYDEEDWEEYRRSKIGYVFQNYSLIGHYSVLDNMLSSLLIMGYDKQTARATAIDYLNQVGLNGYEEQRASELSSGQKQRLSIARALAKNTGIIVADEPTGNLDSETGNQIIRLLKDLSKDRLVIMVTHNYDQAEPYVTRKIRLHDGEIISDVLVNQEEKTEYKAEEKSEHKSQNKSGENNHVTVNTDKKKKEKEKGISSNGLALYFAGKNSKTQKSRVILFTSFLFAISVISFLFIGQLYMHGDDTSTKAYSNDAFYQENDRRLVVKRTDGGVITDNDIEKINSVKDVLMADRCDFANDINYYIEAGRDYEYIYGHQRKKSKKEVMLVDFLNEEHFMMSDDCITVEDLSEGRLPENRNEIVLYSEDNSVLGSNKLCYFTAGNIWDNGEYYKQEFTIVGILKEKTEQVYFSKEMCNMLSMHMDSGIYRLYYAFDFSKQDYLQKPEIVPVINDKLEGNKMILSEKFENPVMGTVLFHFQDKDIAGNFVGDAIEQDVFILESTHDSTGDFAQVSEEFFNTYYKKESTQASVYITSYAKTDSVIKKLDSMGYKAVSTYRLGMTYYIGGLVNERLTIIVISAGGLMVLLLAELMILRSLMKICIKDYFILKSIGMRMQTIKKISYMEIGIYCILAMLLTVVVMWILRLAGMATVVDMMWYYNLSAYLAFVAYNMLSCILTVAAFNHLLKGRLNS